jgi:hypothetical protein
MRLRVDSTACAVVREGIAFYIDGKHTSVAGARLVAQQVIKASNEASAVSG